MTGGINDCDHLDTTWTAPRMQRWALQGIMHALKLGIME